VKNKKGFWVPYDFFRKKKSLFSVTMQKFIIHPEQLYYDRWEKMKKHFNLKATPHFHLWGAASS